jgi:hypothetical protein
MSSGLKAITPPSETGAEEDGEEDEADEGEENRTQRTNHGAPRVEKVVERRRRADAKTERGGRSRTISAGGTRSPRDAGLERDEAFPHVESDRQALVEAGDVGRGLGAETVQLAAEPIQLTAETVQLTAETTHVAAQLVHLSPERAYLDPERADLPPHGPEFGPHRSELGPHRSEFSLHRSEFALHLGSQVSYFRLDLGPEVGEELRGDVLVLELGHEALAATVLTSARSDSSWGATRSCIACFTAW